MLAFLLESWTLCTHQTGGKCLCDQPPASTLVGSLPYIFVTTLCRGELALSSVTCGEGQVNTSTWFPTDSDSSGLALVFGLHNWISTTCHFLDSSKHLESWTCKIPNQVLGFSHSSFSTFSLASHEQVGYSWFLFILYYLWMVCLWRQSQEPGASLSTTLSLNGLI